MQLIIIGCLNHKNNMFNEFFSNVLNNGFIS